MSDPIDLSFPHFVARRKERAAARLREGALYAYAGDRRVRATLGKLRPVTLAVEAAQRHFAGPGRERLLAAAVPAHGGFAAVGEAVRRAALALGMDVPDVFVSGAVFTRDVGAFGPTEAATLLVPGALADHLSGGELLAAVGAGCGHIHNDHAAWLSALLFLETVEGTAVRWLARPAIAALSAWRERAAITADRASLLCVRDLDVALASLCKRFAGQRQLIAEVDVDAWIAAAAEGRPPAGARMDAEILASLAARLKALRIFASTTFYRAGLPDGHTSATSGISLRACDEQVEAILGAG